MEYDKISDRKPAFSEAIDEVDAEILRAVNKFPPYATPHEGYAIILEELDELWDEVKKQHKDRSKEQMRKEAMQVACTAIRFMVDICK